MFTSPYTDQELIDDASRFNSRFDWRMSGEAERLTGKASHYGCALKRGRDFMRQCCGHMPHGQVGNTNRKTWTDDDLMTAARGYKHKGDWKRSGNPTHRAAYQTARRRPEVFTRATAHMTPKASPYSGSYIIYAYEFTDHHVYVGLTFLDKARHIQHMIRGPVFKHQQVCPTYEYKIVEKGLASPVEAVAAEGKWIKHYADAGWSMLNTVRAGGLGTVNKSKWTKEAVLAKAKEFKTRKEWYLKSQFTYSLAKREGWFEQAAAHMPRRVLGIGVGREVSQATRDKQAAAKTGVKQSAQHRANRAAAVKKWWSDRRVAARQTTAESIVDCLSDSLHLP